MTLGLKFAPEKFKKFPQNKIPTNQTKINRKKTPTSKQIQDANHEHKKTTCRTTWDFKINSLHEIRKNKNGSSVKKYSK